MLGDIPFLSSSPVSNLGPFRSDKGRYYARHSQSEAIGDGDEPVSFSFFFEAFDAGWFDEIRGDFDPDSRFEFYSKARLVLLELRIERKSLERYLPFLEQEEAPITPWVEILTNESQGDAPLFVQTSLLAESVPTFLEKIYPVDGNLAARLARVVSIDDIPDADESEIKKALHEQTRRSISHVVAFDVGQGNAAGLFHGDGAVQAYLDFGGGAGPLASTFPRSLKAFCFTYDPPIILSHWDHDHWSSAVRFPTATRQTWIAPRQSVGPIQIALISAILENGELLMLPLVFDPIEIGQIRIERCSGSGRNNGGLAVTLSEFPGGEGLQMLFPGDAKYQYVGSYLGGEEYQAVVVPHHGAKLGPSRVPRPSTIPTSRLVYSYGKGNRYGHPNQNTVLAHNAAGWYPGKTRETSNRGSNGLGHVLLTWNALLAPPLLPCNGQCQLEATQR